MAPEFAVLAETGIGSPGLPFYSREQLMRSPSVEQGMDPDTERRYRLQYTQFITDLGMTLEVPQWSIYTAVFLCHHYFAKRSFQRSDKYLVAVACLYLACKVQESPKYLRDVIKQAEQKKWGKWCREHPLDSKKWEDMVHLEAVRDEVLVAERAVLYTLSFQLRIHTPYPTLLALQAYMPEEHKHNLLSIAWSLTNDSLRTTVSLMYPPEQLAAACVFFAYNTMGLEPPSDKEGRTFCEYSRTTAQQLQDILNIVLSMYETALLPKGSIPATPSQAQDQPSMTHQPTSPDASRNMHQPAVHIRGDKLVADVLQQPKLLPQQQGRHMTPKQEHVASHMQEHPIGAAIVAAAAAGHRGS